MKLKLLATVLIVLALGLNTAAAQARRFKTPGTKIQMHHIHERGRSREEISRQAFRNHRSHQRNFRRNTRRLKADRVVIRKERKGIGMGQRRKSLAIYSVRHNQGNRI